MLTRLNLTHSASVALGIRPEQFWGTMPALPQCIFVATPAELHQHPNRWTWVNLLLELLRRAESLLGGVRLHDDVVPVGGIPASRVHAGARAVAVPAPVTAVYSTYEERELGDVPPELVMLNDADEDGVADYATLFVGTLVADYAALLSREPPQEVMVVVRGEDPYYNPVPVVGKFPYREHLAITVPAPVLVDPEATRGQRAPLDPATVGKLGLVGIWYTLDELPRSTSFVSVRAGFARVGVWIDDVAKAVAAMYPSELCPDCLSELLGQYRTDFVTTRVSIAPRDMLLGTRRGLVEFAVALRQFLNI